MSNTEKLIEILIDRLVDFDCSIDLNDFDSVMKAMSKMSDDDVNFFYEEIVGEGK
jgi:hypothetical protein